ncbi:MAG: Ig-like domain-containing protein, partial [Verrucomicrobiota bacterium]
GGAQGWTASGNQFVASRPNEASDGTWLVRFNSGQTEPNGVLTTTISTVAGASYDLSFDMGTIAYNQKEQRLKVTVRGSSELLSETSAITGVMGGTPKWAAQAYTFVADSSSTTLTFRDVSTVTQDLDLLLDNVRVVEKRSAPISLEATVDQTLTATVEAVDNDSPANVLSYTLVSGPAGATLSSNGQFVWQPTQAPMTALVTVRVSDNGSPSLSDTETFEVVVARNGNSAPVLVVPDQGALAGVEFALPLKATDPDGPADKLTYSLVSGPAGSYVDSSSGTFRWTPSLALLGTSVVVEVAVRDSGSPSLSDSARFTVYVSGPNTAPVLAPIPDQTVPRGEELRLTIRGSDADLPADVLTYTLLVGPSGASLDYATGAFQWRPDASQNLGPYEVRVRVSDDGSPSLGDTKIFRVTVTGPNTAPRLTTVPNQTVGRGSLVMLNLTATDADAPGQTLTYSLVSGPAGATVSAGGLFQYTPSEVGSSVITVQVSDNGVPALTDRKSFTLTATAVNQAPVLSNAADQKVSPGQVLMLALGATDSDTPRNKLTYRLISGPPGAMVDAKTGIFMWRLPKSAPTSLYDVTVSVTDDGAPPLSDTTTFRVTVAGKASRSTQGVEDDSGVLKWVATLNGAETLHFQHAIEPQKQSGEWTHYLESSEDLIHWRRIGPLSPGEELRDTTAGEVSHRFYRVQVEEGSTSSSEAEQIAAVE